MGMHAHWSCIEYGIKTFRAQGAARNSFSTHGSRELPRLAFPPRTNSNEGSCARQGNRCRARRAASTKDKNAAAREAQPGLERPKHTDIICVASVKRTVAANGDGVHRSDFGRQRLAFFQVAKNRLLVRKSHAESTEAKFGDGFQEFAQIFDQERKIDGVELFLDKPCVVQERRKRMANRVANNTVHARAPRKYVRAVEMLQFIKRDLTGSSGRLYRRECECAALTKCENACRQTNFPHGHGDHVLLSAREPQHPQAVGKVYRLSGNFDAICAPTASLAENGSKVLRRLPKMMKGNQDPRLGEQLPQDSAREVAHAFDFEVAPPAAADACHKQCGHLIPNATRETPSIWFPAAGGEKLGLETPPPEPGEEVYLLFLISQPVKPQLDGACLAQSRAELACGVPGGLGSHNGANPVCAGTKDPARLFSPCHFR